MNSHVDDITPSQKKLLMLGFTEKALGKSKSLFDREDVCVCCGKTHGRIQLLDIYYSCLSCQFVLREPYQLRKRYENCKQTIPLEILFAAYGNPLDNHQAIDVTAAITQRVAQSEFHDRLVFKPHHNANEIFGCDPSPKAFKQLKVRYRIDGIFGMLIIDFTPEGTVPTPFMLLVPKNRLVKIFSSYYGHPKGASTMGRMCFDVIETIQSLIDLNGGSFLSISSMTPLTRILGDPCPGYPKDLRLEYEIRGRSGSVTFSEVRGHLRKRIMLKQSPILAPLIYVLSATYGITPTSRRIQLDYLNKNIAKIVSIEHKIREGSRLSIDENDLLKNKEIFLNQRQQFDTLPTNYIDISMKLQKLADIGVFQLMLDKNNFDPNAVFGNPSPGNNKILECQLDCQGHDSEKLTTSNEMMDTGYARNFISSKKNRFNILVQDDPITGKGIMSNSIEFSTEYASPVLIIIRASYGELNDMKRVMDVTHDIQNLVVGGTLTIEPEINLNKLFKRDPSPGKRKQLKIDYITRGYTGNIRVNEKNDFLIGNIELGYRPVPPPDDDDFVIN